MHGIWLALVCSFSMLYQTFWALVFGFTASGIIQAYGARLNVARRFGDHRARTVARSSLWGAVSSSCSYAASSIAKSLVDQGSDFTTAMVFMVASTNLVVDLGVVIWALLGGTFALGEVLGGIVMIVGLTLLLPRTVRPPRRKPLLVNSPSPQIPSASRATFGDAAGFVVGDVTMVRYELLFGFLVAGACAQFVPASLWHHFFWLHHGMWSDLENVVLAPLIAAASFVCSVGNIPLAAALWRGGLSVGGTLAFIYADLLTIPLILMYKKYYGRAVTIRLVASLWFVMSASGLVVQAVLSLVHLTPSLRVLEAAGNFQQVTWTTVLDLLALLMLAIVYLAYRRRSRQPGSEAFAKDPICGMQVAVATASVRHQHDGVTYYFCCEGCRESFVKKLVGGEKS